LALDAPRSRSEGDLRALIGGVRAAAAEHDTELVGGDLCASRGPLRLSVTAIGALASRRRPVGRDRARIGQRVVVTGPLGGSILGRHLRIRPRFDAARALERSGASAMMDVSDGLALDLFRLARASRVGIELDARHIPIHADARRSRRDALDHALHDGEDHELIATLDEGALARARRAVKGLVDIGRVVAGSGLVVVDAGSTPRRWTRGRGGFEHGR
jgi:thiamine-monophosphate kinase